MHSLVTGGAGLIGSHLCDRLLADGHRVTCLDDFYSGAESNIEHLRGHEAFNFVRHDVTRPFEIEADRIYHLACPASPVHYQRDPVRTVRTNVLGALHALELARAGGARVLLASTSEVYGDPEVHPQPETYRGHVNPVGPRSCYDEGKRVAETLFTDYGRQHGVAVRIARIFNTYGPRMRRDDGRVVSNLIVQALHGEPLTIDGDGTQTRSFCYVDDLVDGLVRLMESDHASPLNLGNPDEVSIVELACLVIELTGCGSDLVHGARPTDDPARRCPDIALAHAVLDWHPRTALRRGLAKTIDDLKTREM